MAKHVHVEKLRQRDTPRRTSSIRALSRMLIYTRKNVCLLLLAFVLASASGTAKEEEAFESNHSHMQGIAKSFAPALARSRDRILGCGAPGKLASDSSRKLLNISEPLDSQLVAGETSSLLGESSSSSSSNRRRLLQQSCSANGDPTLDGVVSLSVSGPSGQMVQGAVADWEFGRIASSVNRFTTGKQPIVALVDNRGNIVSRYCPSIVGCSCRDVIYPIRVQIYNNPGCAELLGTTSITTVNGIATFTDLAITKAEYEYQLIFTTGLATSPVTMITPPFQTRIGQIYIPEHELFSPRTPVSQFNCSVCPQLLDNQRRRETCNAIVAGEYLFDPAGRGGISFPTVWVRKFDRQNIDGAPEKDGWVDDVTYDRDVFVSMPDPGCQVREGTSTVLCQQGLQGTTQFRGVNLLLTGGRAIFTDLRIFASGTNIALKFSTGGMESLTYFLNVVPACAFRVVMLRQPGKETTAGKVLSTMPIVQLVDKFNNAIGEQGWMVVLDVQKVDGSPVNMYRCQNVLCKPTALQPYARSGGPGGDKLNEDPPYNGIISYTDLVMRDSSRQLKLTFRATFQGQNRTVLPAVSESFDITSSALDRITILAQPQTEAWVTPDVMPVGTTVGVPFTIQPRIAFVDMFNNVVDSVNGVDMIVTLAGEFAPITTLLGQTRVPAENGIVQYRGLSVDKPGRFWLVFRSRQYQERTNVFDVTFGALDKMVWAMQPTSCGNTPQFGLSYQRQVFDPQPSVLLADQYFNPITSLEYDFIVRLMPVSQTVIVCKDCVAGELLIRSKNGRVTFTDLAVQVDPTKQWEEDLTLQITATNLSNCEYIGSARICEPRPPPEPSPDIVYGKRIINSSAVFGVYNIHSLTLFRQPADSEGAT
jgi:hypothetical protein